MSSPDSSARRSASIVSTPPSSSRTDTFSFETPGSSAFTTKCVSVSLMSRPMGLTSAIAPAPKPPRGLRKGRKKGSEAKNGSANMSSNTRESPPAPAAVWGRAATASVLLRRPTQRPLPPPRVTARELKARAARRLVVVLGVVGMVVEQGAAREMVRRMVWRSIVEVVVVFLPVDLAWLGLAWLGLWEAGCWWWIQESV